MSGVETEQRLANLQWLADWRRWRLRCAVIHQYRQMWPNEGYGYIYQD